DRGGTWEAVNDNTNSQPISGNADWNLVGGVPYAPFTFDGDDLNNANSTPLAFLAAPGANRFVYPLRLAARFLTGSISYPSAAETDWQWLLGPDTFGATFGPSSLQDDGDRIIATQNLIGVDYELNIVGNSTRPFLVSTGINQPLRLQAVADWAGTDGVDA